MRALLAITLLIGNVVLWGAVALSASGPTIESLAADIAEVDSEIDVAKQSVSKYAPTALLGIEAQLRLSILETTKAMLDQKRRSWLRGIDLSYVIDGRTPPALTPEELAAIEKERSDAYANAQKAHITAQQYSGGMLQTLALLEEQTHLVTAAAAAQRIAISRIGLVLPGKTIPAAPAGRQVDDKDAL